VNFPVIHLRDGLSHHPRNYSPTQNLLEMV
jgi:hypothetical protein